MKPSPFGCCPRTEKRVAPRPPSSPRITDMASPAISCFAHSPWRSWRPWRESFPWPSKIGNRESKMARHSQPPLVAAAGRAAPPARTHPASQWPATALRAEGAPTPPARGAAMHDPPAPARPSPRPWARRAEARRDRAGPEPATPWARRSPSRFAAA